MVCFGQFALKVMCSCVLRVCVRFIVLQCRISSGERKASRAPPTEKEQRGFLQISFLGNNLTRFQASAAIKMRSSLFWDVTFRGSVVSYRSFDLSNLEI